MRRAWKLANLSPRTRAFLLSAALGVVTLLVTAIVEALWGDVPDLQAKLIEWGVVGLGVGAASLVALWPLRSAIGLMWDLSEKTSGPHGKAIVPFVQAHLERLHAVSLQMLKPKGTVLSLEEVNTLTELVFDHSQGVYDGTDSNVPSKYTRLYPEYLRQHADSLGGPKERGTRILIVESGALREDAAATPDAYREFVQWHKDHGVRLLHAEPTRARRLASKHGLWTTDVGVWRGDLALLFKPEGEAGVRVEMSPQGKAYDRVARYFDELREAVKDREVPENPALLGAELSSRWGEFVDCERRMAGLGPFLLSVLRTARPGPVLDAAAGTGCEARFLARNGFIVVANEADPKLSPQARALVPEEAGRVQHTQHDWNHFPAHFPEGHFAAVLVLGNSLCLVLDAADRRRCVEHFFRVLRPGGVLVIDERNFPYIQGNRDAIRANPARNFRYRGSVMYCGRTIRGIPRRIEENHVTFLYHARPGAATLEEAEEEYVGTLEMYPFKAGELEALLRAAGFERTEVYSDLEPGRREEADFFTYVAHKPVVVRAEVQAAADAR